MQSRLSAVRPESGSFALRAIDGGIRWMRARASIYIRAICVRACASVRATKYGRADRMTDGGALWATESGDSRDTSSHSTPTHPRRAPREELNSQSPEYIPSLPLLPRLLALPCPIPSSEPWPHVYTVPTRARLNHGFFSSPCD